MIEEIAGRGDGGRERRSEGADPVRGGERERWRERARERSDWRELSASLAILHWGPAGPSGGPVIGLGFCT